jgi:hypothetical protein
MSNDLATRQPVATSVIGNGQYTPSPVITRDLPSRRDITPQVWSMVREMAPVLQQSRLFGVQSVEQAISIMLRGYELGLGLTTSFEFLQVIQGKVGLKPQGALALIYRSGLLQHINIADDAEGCTVTMQRVGGKPYTVRFTLEQARKAGLVKTDSGWANYPANMCRWRAVGFCADVVFPDVTGGLPTSEELGATVDAEGAVISIPTEPTRVVNVVTGEITTPVKQFTLPEKSRPISWPDVREALTKRGLATPDAEEWAAAWVLQAFQAHTLRGLSQEQWQLLLEAALTTSIGAPSDSALAF